MYVSGATPSVPTSDPVQRLGGSSSTVNWHKGSMSKRFDGKEDTHTPSNAPATKGATPVRCRYSLFAKSLTVLR
jgi:protein MPE1